MAASTHLIVCGLPRSGSTLLYQMMQRAGSPMTFLERECPAKKAFDHAGDLATKRPKDVFQLEKLMAARPPGKDIVAVITIRDPRSVVASVHQSYPDQHFIGFDQSLFVQPEAVSYTDPGLLAYAAAVEAAAKTGVRHVQLRYEDLVTRPHACRERLAAGLGLDFTQAFTGLDGAQVSERFGRSLNGARDLDATRISAWARESGARIVRQFRLAPALFDIVERWGYERDRAWFDQLAQRHPAATDDRPGRVVGFHTEDRVYRREAARLAASLRRLGLPFELTPIPPADWLATVRKKVGFLQEQRRRHRGPLLYVDVDAVLHSDPWPYLNGTEADVAFAVLRDGRARSGTVFLADTPGAQAFLADWSARLEAAPEAADQDPLTGVVAERRRGLPGGYRVQLLPPALCYIFDRAAKLGGKDSTPVIEHLQASRESRRPGSGTWARRQQRVRELDAALGLPEA